MTARRSAHSGHSFTSVRAMITLGVGTGQGPKARDVRPGGPRPQVTATEVRYVSAFSAVSLEASTEVGRHETGVDG
jgi:hypothetical protein